VLGPGRPAHRPAVTPPPGRRGALRRYLVSERYADTVAHGLFHFTVIMLAFIIGNVWASHDAELRDLRGQYAVLLPLKEELDTFQAQVLVNELNPPMLPSQEKRSSDSYGPPPTPCQNGFASAYSRNTAGWRSIRQQDRYYLLADWAFYVQLDTMYKTAASESDAAVMATTRADCQKHWKLFGERLIAFNKVMNAHLVDLQDQYAGPWWRFSQHHVRILLYTLAGLAIVLALPVLIRAGENTLRRWPVLNPRDEAAADPAAEEGGAPSDAARERGGGAPAGRAGPDATGAAPATTTGSR